MGENGFVELGEPFYADKNNRLKLYHDDSSDEHRIVIDGKYHVFLHEGALKCVGRGHGATINYITRQLRDLYDLPEEEVAQFLLRGSAELEKLSVS